MKGLSPLEHQSLLLSVGTHRSGRRYSPIEVASAFAKAIKAGASLEECAEAAQFDGPTMVSRFLRLLRLPHEVQHLIAWGQSGSTIAFTAASELTRLPEGDDRAVVVRAVLENELGTGEVKQLVQLRLRSGATLEDCIASVLKMRPRTEQRHVFIGAVTAPAAQEPLSQLLQKDRDAVLARALHRAFPSLTGASARLGTDRFTVVGGPEVAAILNRADPNFEAVINSHLGEALSDVSN